MSFSFSPSFWASSTYWMSSLGVLCTSAARASQKQVRYPTSNRAIDFFRDNDFVERSPVCPGLATSFCTFRTNGSFLLTIYALQSLAHDSGRSEDKRIGTISVVLGSFVAAWMRFENSDQVQIIVIRCYPFLYPAILDQ